MRECTCELYGGCVYCWEKRNKPRQAECEHVPELLVSERVAYDIKDGEIQWDTGTFITGGINPVFYCLICGDDLGEVEIDGVQGEPALSK